MAAKAETLPASCASPQLSWGHSWSRLWLALPDPRGWEAEGETEVRRRLSLEVQSRLRCRFLTAHAVRWQEMQESQKMLFTEGEKEMPLICGERF